MESPLDYSLIVDDRERAIIPLLETYHIAFVNLVDLKIERIEVGDYCIAYRDRPIIMIERKTWKDLAASFKDGRIGNVRKLIEARESIIAVTTTTTQLPPPFHPRIVYIIEGKQPAVDTHVSHVNSNALRSHLIHLMVRDGINVVYTKSADDTARTLYEMVKSISTLFVRQATAAVDGGVEPCRHASVEVLHKKHQTTPADIVYKMWCCLPGITTKTATLLIDSGITINAFLLGKVAKDQLYTMKYSSGSIIGTRADKMLAICNPNNSSSNSNSTVYKHLLACIPGISDKSAANILESDLLNGTLSGLLEGKYTVEQVAAIKKSAKAKVGSKAAKAIIEYLSCGNNGTDVG